MSPAYLEAARCGILSRVSEKIFSQLSSCTLCPRRCQVNRLKNEKGYCKTGLKAGVYSYMPHYGEEPPLSGKSGSGTIFFSHCNLSCVYCQNYEFSQLGKGREVDLEELAGFMIELQNLGCHNINFVTPTHVLPQILKSLELAVKDGLKIPLVYNTSGYELPQIIRCLSGIVDIYLPDMRYADNASAIKYSNAPDYPKYNQAAVKEMHWQVGIAKINSQGIIEKGLIIRHLVLPQNISGTEKILRFINQVLSPKSYISLMSQYHPCYQASKFPELSCRLTFAEYSKAKLILEKYNLDNGWSQEDGGLARFAGTNIKPSL